MRVTGMSILVSYILVVYDKFALVLWLLHQIKLYVVNECNGVYGSACSEVGKELELAKASHLLYAVFKYLLTRLLH